MNYPPEPRLNGHYLFFDTETTGLPKDYKDPTHPDTPHIVELAAILTDETGRELSRLHVLVKPDGYTIPDEVAAIHKIDTATAMQHGVPLWSAIWQFDRMCSDAKALVAHNHSFDRLIMKGAHHRLGIPHRFRHLERVCTKEMSTGICRISKANGKGIKWPTLTEAHTFFFGVPFEGAHGAMVDTMACMRVFFEMKKRERETV